MWDSSQKGENPSALGKNKIQWITDLPAGLRGRVILGKGNRMDNNELGTNLAEVGTKIEPLTDKEQRIFLAAMGRERKVCKEVDDQYTHEPYEVLLTKVCDEIERKVKGALWMI